MAGEKRGSEYVDVKSGFARIPLTSQSAARSPDGETLQHNDKDTISKPGDGEMTTIKDLTVIKTLALTADIVIRYCSIRSNNSE